MGCSYYENKGGSGFFGGFDPYCHKKGDRINSDVYDKYCKGYSYSDCPIYRGSSSSSSGCYLTSACVYAKGLPDDCYELSTLRRFRDTWLALTDGGKDLIKKYYEIAPKIVSNINEHQDKKSIYESIYYDMVLPCVELIKDEKYEETMELYREMTLMLEKAYC